jgi:hypothetical protein
MYRRSTDKINIHRIVIYCMDTPLVTSNTFKQAMVDVHIIAKKYYPDEVLGFREDVLVLEDGTHKIDALVLEYCSKQGVMPTGFYIQEEFA